MRVDTIHTMSDIQAQSICFLILDLAVPNPVGTSYKPGEVWLSIHDWWKYKFGKSKSIPETGLREVCVKVTHVMMQVPITLWAQQCEGCGLW